MCAWGGTFSPLSFTNRIFKSRFRPGTSEGPSSCSAQNHIARVFSSAQGPFPLASLPFDLSPNISLLQRDGRKKPRSCTTGGLGTWRCPSLFLRSPRAVSESPSMAGSQPPALENEQIGLEKFPELSLPWICRVSKAVCVSCLSLFPLCLFICVLITALLGSDGHTVERARLTCMIRWLFV